MASQGMSFFMFIVSCILTIRVYIEGMSCTVVRQPVYWCEAEGETPHKVHYPQQITFHSVNHMRMVQR
jgi:hypothetical protein